MKRTLFAAIIVLFSLNNLISQDVSYQEALTVAENHLNVRSSAKALYIRTDIDESFKDKSLLYYVFQIEPKGFVVVSRRKEMPPIIAYSFTNNYIDDDSPRNPLRNLFLSDEGKTIQKIEKMDKESIEKNHRQWAALLSSNMVKNPLFQQWPPEGTTETEGWVETNWTQEGFYKKFCPMDPVTNQRSYVGCPATAMAQIVNYYRTTNATQFSDEDDYHHNYAGRNYWIDDDYEEHDFLSFPQINTFLDSISGKFESEKPLSIDDKAALSFACGVAANQVYTSEGSGTFGVGQAMDAYQKFGFEDALLLNSGDTSFYSHFSQNMMDGRPVHLALVNESWTVGHNVVLDGYNTDDYYHLNFGWGGTFNGWYLIPEEIPYDLTVIEGAVVDIAFPSPSVSINENLNKSLSEITVYPNPCKDFLKVGVAKLDSEILSLTISDFLGKTIYESNKTFDCTYPNNIIQIDFTEGSNTNIKSGIYILSVKTKDSCFTTKFFKQ